MGFLFYFSPFLVIVSVLYQIIINKNKFRKLVKWLIVYVAGLLAFFILRETSVFAWIMD